MGNTEARDTLPQRVKRFYERVTTEREGALEDLPRLYSADVHFVNPVVNQRGLEAFVETWKKALKQYKVFEFHELEVTGTETLFSLTYSMRIKFAMGPIFTTDMSTDCHGQDGRVVYCRDYFDPLGALVQPFAPLDWMYKKVFGWLVA